LFVARRDLLLQMEVPIDPVLTLVDPVAEASLLGSFLVMAKLGLL